MRVSYRSAFLLAILLELAVLYLLMRDGSWVFDDNFLLVRAGQEGFTWHWITTVQYEHWDVALNLILSLQHRLFFFDYRWGLIAMLAVLGGCICLLELCLATIVQRRWIAGVLALWFGLNLLWARPLQWWTAGVQYFGYTLFDLVCLYAFLRYHVDRAGRWIAISAASLAAALLFYEKPAYMLLYLALMRILLMSERLRPAAIVRTFWDERRLWLSYLFVVGLWAVGYLGSGAYNGTPAAVSIGQYLTYFRILWLQTLIPVLAGVTIPAHNLDTSQLTFVIVSQLAVLACVVASVVRKRSAWRAWLFLAVVVLTSGVLVARSRIGQFGVDIANDPRYLIDFAWLAPLTLCAAFTDGNVLRLHAPSRPTLGQRPRLGVAIAVGAVLIAYAAGSVASADHVERDWPGSRARIWEQNVRRDVADLRRRRVQFVIADNATPFEIMEPFVAPYNRLSRVLPMYVGPVQVDGPLRGQLMTVHLDGTVHPAVLDPIVTGASPRGLVQANQLTLVGGRLIWEGSDACVVADGAAAELQRRLVPAPGSGSAPYYLRIVYRAWTSQVLALFVDTGKGYPGVADHWIAVRPGQGESISWLGPDPPHNLMVTLPALTSLCLGAVQVVTLRDG